MNDQRTWKGSHTMSGPQLLRFLLWLHPTSIINHSEIGVMFTNLGPTLLQEMFISPKIDWRVEFPTHIDSLSEKRRRQRGLPKGSWWFQMSQAVPSKETQIRKQLKTHQYMRKYWDILWKIFESRTLPLFCHLSPAWPEPAKTWKNPFSLCQHTIHRLLSQVANFSQNFWTSSCASANARGLFWYTVPNLGWLAYQ